jgi:Tol biopolymer transport system component
MQVQWNRFARTALALAGLLVVAGVANAQYFGQNKVQYRDHDWHSIHSDHFEVYFDAGADSLAMRTLDLAEKTQALFAKRTGHQLSKRIPIILYASHQDFAETNVTTDLISGSTGGFTEALRDRVVVPFSGSYEDFRHVLVHELVHAFQFDIFYNSPGVSLLSGQGLFSVPLWFAEGMAEYFSLGMEPNAEMYVRDGTLTGYLPPLEYAGGYLVYKMGQCAIQFLLERYGEDRFRDLLRRGRQMHNFERAFQRTYGMTPQRFDEQWREELRKKYWPTLANLDHPDKFARRLTDHRRDESLLNFWPSVSPQGDRVAYFSDRSQYNDVYLMSAFDGRVLRRVVRAERNLMFEAIPLLRTSIAWSPEGDRLALVASSGGRDRLYIVDANDGRVLKRIDVPGDELSFPAWSPVSDSIVVSALLHGRSDLWIVNAATGTCDRITDNAWDEKEPTWSPDGKRLTFASDRLAPVVLSPVRKPDGFGRYALFDMDLATHTTRFLLDTSGDDHAPAWSPDGRRLAFITDRSGASNLAVYDTRDSTITQLTDLTGGVQSVSWSRQNDRLVFAAFDRGGYDIFSVQQPLSSESAFKQLRANSPGSVLSVDAARLPPAPDSSARMPRGALASAWPDSATAPDTTLAMGMGEGHHGGPHGPFAPVAAEPPAWNGGAFPSPAPMAVEADTVNAPLPEHTPLMERGGPFALADSVLGQQPLPYRWHLAPEAVQVGALAASSYGFAGSTQLAFSDFLGDHSLYFAGDVFSNSISDANALLLYNVLPHRLDWNVGAFHFKNFYQASVTSLGEQLSSAKLFSERKFGALFGVSYPFDRFRRVEAQFTQMFVEEQFFNQLITGDVINANHENRAVTAPSVTLVGDNSLFGEFGPVNGGRWNLTYTAAVPLFPNALTYNTVTVDKRRYWDLSRGNSFAVRLLGGTSFGRNPQVFRVGGFSTLRGFPDFILEGTHLALGNFELRFPFISDLGVVGPLPLGNLRMRGVLFMDVGEIWSDGTSPRFWIKDFSGRHLGDSNLSFGTGVRSWVLGLPMKLDVAWATDLLGYRRPLWTFSIGPEF